MFYLYIGFSFSVLTFIAAIGCAIRHIITTRSRHQYTPSSTCLKCGHQSHHFGIGDCNGTNKTAVCTFCCHTHFEHRRCEVYRTALTKQGVSEIDCQCIKCKCCICEDMSMFCECNRCSCNSCDPVDKKEMFTVWAIATATAISILLSTIYTFLIVEIELRLTLVTTNGIIYCITMIVLIIVNEVLRK